MSEILSSLGVHWHSLLAQVVNFSIVAFVLYKFAIKPAIVSLDARVKKQEESDTAGENISKRLTEIEASKEQILKEAREEGKKMLEASQKAAKESSDKLHAQANTEAEKLITETKKKLEEEREILYKDIKKEISTLVSVGIEKTIGKYVTPEVEAKIATEALAEISKSQN